MNRRRFLRNAGAVGSVTLAGCLERLGFEEQSAWRDPPLVDDRPDAVYVPASTEEMGVYGTADDGEYAVALSYTFPHRFWNVTGDEKEKVVVEADDSLHLMVTAWDPRTDTVLPVDMGLEILRDGENVATINPWPMLSQRMGFHYGDNVTLPEEGEYTAAIRVGPVQIRRTGAFAGRFESASTLEIDFEYDGSEIVGLDFESVDADRRGEPGALDLMKHGSHGDHGEGEEGGHDGHGNGPPASTGRPIEDLSGTELGSARSGDAQFTALRTDANRFVDRADDGSGAYLGVFARTPYNDVIVPKLPLAVTIERDGERIFEDALVETLDGEWGHHYGRALETLASGDRIALEVETPPNVSRHDGYETAFFDFESVQFTV